MSKGHDFKRKFGEKSLDDFLLENSILRTKTQFEPRAEGEFRSYRHAIGSEVMFAKALVRRNQSLGLGRRSLASRPRIMQSQPLEKEDYSDNEIVFLKKENSSQTDDQLVKNELSVQSELKNKKLSAQEAILADQDMTKLLSQLIQERNALIRMMESNYKFFDKFANNFGDIQAQSLMTKMLLDDLMDYAQLKNNSFNVTNEYFDLSKVVKQCFLTNQHQAKAKKVTFEGPIFTKQEDAIFFQQLYGDSRRYLQILVNFVNNAVKFSQQGGKVSILVEVRNLSSKDKAVEENK